MILNKKETYIELSYIKTIAMIKVMNISDSKRKKN